MTKKLTPSHIAVAVAAGLTAQTALAQTPPAQQSSIGAGQEMTPTLRLENNQYSGQGFFEKPASVKKAAPAPKVEDKPATSAAVNNAPSVIMAPAPANLVTKPAAPVTVNKAPIKDPMLPLDIVGSKDAKENTKGSLTPPLAKKDTAPIAAVSGLKKPDALLTVPSPPVLNGVPSAAIPMMAGPAPVVVTEKVVPEKVSKPVVVVKTKTIAKKTTVARKAVAEAPFSTFAKQAVPVEVKELPGAGPAVAPALYAAEPTTPIMVTEVVRIDSISLQAPTIAEQETQPLPRLPEPETVIATIVPAPLPAPLPVVIASAPVAPVVAAQLPPPSPPPAYIPPVGRVDVPMASASMDDLPSMEAPSVETIRNNSRFPQRAQTPLVQVPKAQASVPVFVPYVTPKVVPAPVMPPVMVAAAPALVPQAPQENRDARIEALLAELKTLQRNPIVMQSVLPPVEIIAPQQVAVPKIDPAATIQLPLPEEPRPLVKPTPKEPPRMVTQQAPKTAVDAPQTAAIDAPRTMTRAPVLEPRQHRVANPKFVGLPEKGDFIAFMPGSSHVSEETVDSLRSMVDVFKQHGIRKIVLTGTALRDEDTEDMESSDFAQKRAKNLKAAFQRAGFKGVVALDDPKRARPGTTPRVGLVALQ